MKLSWLMLAALLAAASVEAAEFDCVIEARSLVSLGAHVEGVIEKVHVERGASVKKGQPLVEIESSVERANLAYTRERAEMKGPIEKSKIRLSHAELVLERLGRLHGSDVLSEKELDEARSSKALALAGVRDEEDQRKLARLDVRRAEAALALRTVRSPVDGVVVRRTRSPGEYADTSELMVIAEVDPLNVEAFLPVEVARSVEVGATAEVRPESLSGEVLEAAVEVVDPIADSASGLVGVRLELPNPDERLLAGLRCALSFSGP